MPNPFHQLLDSIREATTTETDKGKRFEVLIKRFLQAEPTYKERFADVWLWTEWPYRMGKGDVGIDLVARESVSGRYVAIQCKCYDNGHAVSEKDLEIFFLAAGSTWATDNAKEDTFESTMVFATSYYQSKNLASLIQRQARPCQYIGLSELERYEDIDWASLEKGKIHKVKKNEVREHQREAIDSVISSFKGGTERGKMIMACGTGKTFTALRLVEEWTGGEGCVLFLAPSIALMAQSLREWMCQTTCKLHPIAVCSDSTASDGRELGDLTARDLPSPATTNPDAIGANYRKFKDGHLTDDSSTVSGGTLSGDMTVASGKTLILGVDQGIKGGVKLNSASMLALGSGCSVEGAVSGSGTIVKENGGTASVSGGMQGFSGSLEVQGGILNLMNAASVNVQDVTIQNGALGVYSGNSADEAGEGTLTIKGAKTLTAGPNAALNANLVMETGSKLDVRNTDGQGLLMGSTVTLNQGMTLNDYSADWATWKDGTTYVLFSGVDGLNIGDDMIAGVLGYNQWVDAKEYFTNIEEANRYFLCYGGAPDQNAQGILTSVNDGSNVGMVYIMTMPEPTTSTLSLLALAALAARRRKD